MAESECVRARLARGELVYGTMLFETFTPGITAILADCGYDWVILDTEHSGVGIETVKQQIAFARGLDIEVWVRVPEKSYAAVAAALDAGAHGIMVPMMESAEEAAALVDWARYRPEGRRGLAFGIGHDAYRGRAPLEEMRAANARNVLIGLIETRRGIENAEAILATPGLDIGWLGHFDLTNDLGVTAAFDHPDFAAAVDRLVEAGRRTGKALGILDGNPAMVRSLADRGFRTLGYAHDVAVLRQGFTAGLQKLQE